MAEGAKRLCEMGTLELTCYIIPNKSFQPHLGMGQEEGSCGKILRVGRNFSRAQGPLVCVEREVV